MTVTELTTDAIDAMPAGREMDALIHQKVFDISVKQRDGDMYPSNPDDDRYYVSIPLYSTYIAAAMEAADLFPAFRLRRVHWAHLVSHVDETGKYTEDDVTNGEIGHYENGWWAAGTHEGSLSSFAETAPLAICRTILIAKL